MHNWYWIFSNYILRNLLDTPPSKIWKILVPGRRYLTMAYKIQPKAGGGLITLIRDNITFTTTDIPSTINTHNTKLQMVKVHINNTKHITIANIYIPPRDSTSTRYKTAGTDIQYITNIPHSVLTGDVNTYSTLWHSYSDDHRGTNSRCHL